MHRFRVILFGKMHVCSSIKKFEFVTVQLTLKTDSLFYKQQSELLCRFILHSKFLIINL